MAVKNSNLARAKRHARVRAKVFGTTSRPRLNVFRSLSGLYAQIIDDVDGHTLVSASSVDKDLREKMNGMKKAEQAKFIGQAVAERAKSKGITTVVFDRGGYRYIGRVKALADGAREGGLKF
jgi:large subunit ribosomal protein L18